MDFKREKTIPSFFDLTLCFEMGKGSAFGLDPPSKISLLPQEAGCQADRISFCAHASGTHTECAAHITKVGDFASIFQTLPPLQRCLLLRVEAEIFGECGGDTYLKSVPQPQCSELVISKRILEKAFQSCPVHSPPQALLLQIPNTSWVFFTDQAMEFVSKEKKITALLVTLASVDREACGSHMPAHTIFFQNREQEATITEHVRFDESVSSGEYWLNLQLSPFLGTDAVPSRVLLLPYT